MKKTVLAAIVLAVAAFGAMADATPSGAGIGVGYNEGGAPWLVLKFPHVPTYAWVYYGFGGGGTDGIDVELTTYLLDVKVLDLFSINLGPTLRVGWLPLFAGSTVQGFNLGVGARLGISWWILPTVELAATAGYGGSAYFQTSGATLGSQAVTDAAFSVSARYYFGL